MNIADWLRRARALLADAGCPDPEIDARWMAEDALSMSRAELALEPGRALAPEALERLEAMLRRRIGGEPVQYILGRADFMGLPFYVDARVLIPRQDTETLAEAALAALAGRSRPSVLDLCAGSGCLGLSLKVRRPDATVVLADVSPDALDVARRNMRTLGAAAELCRGDLYAAVAGRRFDCVVSNPPYIPRAELPALQREVRREPALALDGGPDGLDFYRRIARGAPDHLNPGGAILLEVGVGEAPAVLGLLRARLDCADAGVVRDLNGVDRVVWARRTAEA